MTPKSTLRALRNAIAGHFSKEELSDILRYSVGVGLEWISPGKGTYERIVADVLLTAERAEWTQKLVEALYRARPSVLELGKVAAELGVTPQMELQSVKERLAGSPDPSLLDLAAQAKYLSTQVWLTRAAETADQICRVEHATHGPVGTGFLVGPDIVMTTAEVVAEWIDQPGKFSPLRFRFDYKAFPDGSSEEGVDFEPEMAETPGEAGYAVVRLKQPPGLGFPGGGRGGKPRGWIQLPPTATQSVTGEPAIILYYPNVGPMQLVASLGARAEWDMVKRCVRYALNTGTGAAGAPCFDVDWNLVAIHGGSIEATGVSSTFNWGIPVAAIANHLPSKEAESKY